MKLKLNGQSVDNDDATKLKTVMAMGAGMIEYGPGVPKNFQQNDKWPDNEGIETRKIRPKCSRQDRDKEYGLWRHGLE